MTKRKKGLKSFFPETRAWAANPNIRAWVDASKRVRFESVARNFLNKLSEFQTRALFVFFREAREISVVMRNTKITKVFQANMLKGGPHNLFSWKHNFM